jgi:putative transposase
MTKYYDRAKSKAKLRHDRHTVSLIGNHLVITPKYRAKVLTGEIAVECEQIIRKICLDMDCKIIRMAVSPDHVHIFLRYPPKLSLSLITQRIKGLSSKHLRDKFPNLKEWNPKHLWAPGAFHGSVGSGFEVIEKYIENQRDP